MTKTPFITADKLEQITAEFPTPFHLYDEKGIRETARAVNAAFSWNPGFKEFFAVKATPNPAILRILKEEGCGVDCATDTELVMSKKIGFDNTAISFTSNDTRAEEFVYARNIDATINLDAYEDIFFLEEVAGLPKTLSLRFNPGGVFSLGTDIMDHPEESKFGMTKEHSLRVMPTSKKKGLNHLACTPF